MIYDDEYQSLLNKDLDEFFTNRLKQKIFTKDFLYKSFKVYNYEEDYGFCSENLVEFKIFFENEKFEVKVNEKIRKSYLSRPDTRIESTIKLIENSLQWGIQNNLSLKKSSFGLWIWICDRVPWVDSSQTFPVFVVARPRQLKFPLFPDPSYVNAYFEGRYHKKTHTWDQVKKEFKNEVKKVKTKDKEIFFKGYDTTKKQSNMRKLFNNASLNGNTNNIDGYKLNIEVPPKKHIPLFKEAPHKSILLDLPGRYPWSVRLKNLFLANSSVIRIIENWKSADGEWEDIGGWEQLFDFVIEPFNDIIHTVKSTYLNYSYEFKYLEKDLNEKEFKRVLERLRRVVKRIKNNPEKEKKNIKTLREQTSKLTNDRISQYIFRCLEYASDINFIDFNFDDTKVENEDALSVNDKVNFSFSNYSPNFYNKQKKSFLSEVEFLSLSLKDLDNPVVVYAGISNDHFDLIFDMFPSVKKWVLVDPNLKIKKSSSKIIIIKDEYTNEMSIQINKKFGGNNILFITSLPKEEWFLTLKGRRGMFPYNDEGKHLKGEIFTPAFDKKGSTDGILITDDMWLSEKTGKMLKKFTPRFMTYKTVLHNSMGFKMYNHPIRCDLKWIKKGKKWVEDNDLPFLNRRIFHTYDYAREIQIIDRYIDYLNSQGYEIRSSKERLLVDGVNDERYSCIAFYYFLLEGFFEHTKPIFEEDDNDIMVNYFKNLEKIKS